MASESLSGSRHRPLLVQKFGGTSLGGAERIEKSASIVLDKWEMGAAPVVVVSAMSGETNRLEKIAHTLSYEHNAAMELVLSAGEQVSVGLMGLALDKLARERGLIAPDESIATPYMAHQLPIGTHSKSYAEAKIDYLNHAKVFNHAQEGKITVLPGYQAFNGEEVLTLGRGGSDTSAVSIAGLLQVEICEIYTDVDGVYSTDPRLCKDAVKYHTITTEKMRLLSHYGAKVMHVKAIEAAHKYKVAVVVKSSFKPQIKGTLIVHPDLIDEKFQVNDSRPDILGMTVLKEVRVLEIPYYKEEIKTLLEGEIPLISLTHQDKKMIQVIVENKYLPHILEKLKANEYIAKARDEVYHHVTLLGENLHSNQLVKNQVEATLKEVHSSNPKEEMISLTQDKERICFLVGHESAPKVAEKVHDRCREFLLPERYNPDPFKILEGLFKGRKFYGI